MRETRLRRAATLEPRSRFLRARLRPLCADRSHDRRGGECGRLGTPGPYGWTLDRVEYWRFSAPEDGKDDGKAAQSGLGE